ncbi:MAG: S8/S53 family peptidase [Frankiaceae bacterium]|nr:S8/S53 family peptidase [Frankiaceae bacterium]
MPPKHVRPVLIGITTFALGCGGTVAATAGHAAASQRMGAGPVTATMTLAGDVVPGLLTHRDLGRTSPTRQLIVDLNLTRPDVAGEKALWNAMYTKGDPSYHHFLTPAQFDARFGVAPQTYAAVRTWATRAGLDVVNAPGSRDILQLSGTAAQVEKTFSVTLRDFRIGGRRVFANTNAPTVPAGHSVQGLVGLTNLYRSTTARTRGPKPAQDGCGAPAGCTNLTTPRDLWSAYKMPGGAKANPIGNLKTDFGQGQQMAVFGEGQSSGVIANLRTFEQLNKLPRVPVTVVRTDGKKKKYDDNAGETEWDLDTQSSTAMSPDVRREVLYFGTALTDASVLGVFSAWANDPHGPLQANASYGECEENPAGDTEGTVTPPFSAGAMFTVKSEDVLRKATMEGRTLFSSTGDTGGTCPLLPVSVNGVGYEIPGVEYPAVSPYVVGVGGTILYTDGSAAAKRVTEYGWTYGGGGSSVDFPKPAYQNGISAISGVCAFAPGGGTGNSGKPCRGLPDIAAQSGDVASNGFAIVAGGETAYPGGGTSLSSPLSMGMWTRIQAAAPGTKKCGKRASFKGLGFANPALYAAYKSKHGGRDFFDVGGPKHSIPSDAVPYPSTPGWDYQSGMGVMQVSRLARDLTGRKSLRPAFDVLPKQPKDRTSAKRANPCAPLFTDPAGDDAYIGDPNGTGGNPQLDVLAGNITYLPAKKALRTVMVIKNLSTDAANAEGGGNEYYFLWNYKGKQYFTDAEVDSVGAVTYHDGYVDGTTFTTANDDTGQFVAGKNGRVVVDVPLANIGSPAKGATLTAPAAQTRVLVGTAGTGGLIEQADGSSPGSGYVVGQRCKHKTGIAPPPYKASGASKSAKIRYHRAGKPGRIAKHGHNVVKRKRCKAKLSA